MEETFKIRIQNGYLYFGILYGVAFVVEAISGKPLKDLLAIIFVGALIFFWLLCFRPYKYVVVKNNFIIKRRLLKDIEIDLLDVDTLCDYQVKMLKFTSNPNALEFYMSNGKRKALSPRDVIAFTDCIKRHNKRIHIEVASYAAKYSNEIKRGERRRRKNKGNEE